MKTESTVLAVFLVVSLFAGTCLATQSTITVAEGVACMGDDKSRKETQSAAMAEAKRNAVERTLTYVTSETKMKDFVLEKDLVNAYSRASVKVLEILQRSWERDPAAGDCFRVRVRRGRSRPKRHEICPQIRCPFGGPIDLPRSKSMDQQNGLQKG